MAKFKTDFATLNKNWEEVHSGFQSKKDNFDFEVDKVCDQIDSHFSDLIRKLEESKKRYIEAFKLRAKDELKDFLGEYDSFNAYYANVKQKSEEIEHIEDIYKNSSDFDLVKENLIRQNDEMFKGFCPEYSKNLDDFKKKFDEIEKNSSYTFHFSTATKDEEIINNVHKNIKIKMKIEDKDDMEEIKTEQPNNEEVVKKGNIKGDTGTKYNLTFKQLYKIEKTNRKLIVFDFKAKKAIKMSYTEPTPDEHNNAEMNVRNMSQIVRGVLSPDSKSCSLDCGDIYAFGASETKFSDCMYTVDGSELEECQNLPVKRKKISCVACKEFVYFTGEFENINVNRASLERYDTEKQVFEQIYGLNKQSNYILCIVDNRYLYAFPCSINTYKVLVLDLEHLSAYKDSDKEHCYKGDWLKFSPKNPNNINLYLSYKSSAAQISKNEVFISSLKYGYIYNTETHQFTGQYNYAADDEFYDGFYLKDHILYGFGTKGIHKFDLVLKQFKLIKTTPKGLLEDQSDNGSSDSESHKVQSHNERGMSDNEDDY